MGMFAVFHFVPKEIYEEYCKLAQLVPMGSQLQVPPGLRRLLERYATARISDLLTVANNQQVFRDLLVKAGKHANPATKFARLAEASGGDIAQLGSRVPQEPNLMNVIQTASQDSQLLADLLSVATIRLPGLMVGPNTMAVGVGKARGATKSPTKSRRVRLESERQKQEDYSKARILLKQNSKEPFEYRWNGCFMLDAFRYLKNKTSIDIVEEHSLVGSGMQWIVLDRKFKDKYFQELDPSRFAESDLLRFYIASEDELQKNLKLKRPLSKYSQEQLIEMMSNSTDYRAFPEAGKAMWNAIDIIHKYLALIDDRSVVMLNIS